MARAVVSTVALQGGFRKSRQVDGHRWARHSIAVDQHAQQLQVRARAPQNCDGARRSRWISWLAVSGRNLEEEEPEAEGSGDS